MAIVLPREDGAAARLATTCTALIAGTPALTSLVCAGLAEPIARGLDAPEIAPWLGATGPLVFLTAEIQMLSYWFTRLSRHGAISGNRAQQAAVTFDARIPFGAGAASSFLGLLGGPLFGACG